MKELEIFVSLSAGGVLANPGDWRFGFGQGFIGCAVPTGGPVEDVLAKMDVESGFGAVGILQADEPCPNVLSRFRIGSGEQMESLESLTDGNVLGFWSSRPAFLSRISGIKQQRAVYLERHTIQHLASFGQKPVCAQIGQGP